MGTDLLHRRSAGVLLHPTSLPSQFGVGDLGPAARAWVDSLKHSRQRWWQVLPFGPTGYGDSPYQSFSAFAGNPILISPELLRDDGLITEGELEEARTLSGRTPSVRISYGEVLRSKEQILTLAFDRFMRNGKRAIRDKFDEFCSSERAWLDDYALFMTCKGEYGGAEWLRWDRELVMREPGALRSVASRAASTLQFHRFAQFLFFRQWEDLKKYAQVRGIGIIGDLPIFVAGDSADVWSNPELFRLDSERRPLSVAGVPPDYFSATGQLWGNPVYDWKAARESGYQWWIDRMAALLRRVDVARIDHFRGFCSCWEVPAESRTAEPGRWVPGPGADLFDTVAAALGRLPFIAEDLGVITDDVRALRRRFDFPGMRILQFAFGGAVEERFLPHNYEANTVVYTGTHDNDTTCGWYAAATATERKSLARYVGEISGAVHWDLIRLGWASVATLALAPVQDVLGLGSDARMNVPGTSSGNWTWRLDPDAPIDDAMNQLRELTETYGRVTEEEPAQDRGRETPNQN